MSYEELVESKKNIGDMTKEELFIYCQGLVKIKRIDYLEITKDLEQEIERLNKRIITLEETIREANNNVLKDIAMIKTHEMIKQEIVQRLIETSKILESGSDKE